MSLAPGALRCAYCFLWRPTGVMIGPLPAHAVLGLVTAGLRAQGEDLVIHRKRKRQGVKGVVRT